MQKVINFGIKGLIIHENKYLAVHKANIEDDKYELPGGRLEFGETIEQTLVREMKEELNVIVTPLKLIDTWNYINKTQTLQITGIIYLCKVKTLETLKLSLEHTDYQWFELGDIQNMNCLFEPRMKSWDWEFLKLLVKDIKKN